MPTFAARLPRAGALVLALLLLTGLLSALVTGAAPLAPAPAARADGPGVGTPYVVTVGDSYISGEAGRWAGSSNESSARADALGATAYHDTPSGEAINRCHRSRSAEAFFGSGTQGRNLACSGATTVTDASGSTFKPGLDFYDDGAGRIGQAKALQQFAAGHNVKMVVVSIGGNDFDFAGIVTRCVANWLSSPSWWKDYCHDDSAVTANFTTANVNAVRSRIAGAFQNLRTAMRNAGYADNAWTLMVQTYPSPIPKASGFRYAETGYTRQSVGGCGFWNADATWANDTALPTINNTVRAAIGASGLTNTRVLDLASAFNGRRLCETGVGLYEEKNVASWTSPGAVDKTEWVNQIRTVSTCCSDSPYYVQESLHPNYWAQLATRSCLRQAWNAGSPRSGACSIAGTGLSGGEPRMVLR